MEALVTRQGIFTDNFVCLASYSYWECYNSVAFSYEPYGSVIQDCLKIKFEALIMKLLFNCENYKREITNKNHINCYIIKL